MRDGAMIAVVMRVPMIERKRGLNRAAQISVMLHGILPCTDYGHFWFLFSASNL
jgi:hypothetical protein